MSKYLIEGKKALRASIDGRSLEMTTSYPNNGGNWSRMYTLNSGDGKIEEIFRINSTQINVITDKKRLQFYYSSSPNDTSCNYQSSYGL